MEDERTLQATFTGPIGQQVGLHLLQAGQQGAAGTAEGKPAGDSSDFGMFILSFGSKCNCKRAKPT